MLKLLLDEHISPAVARELHKKNAKMEVISLHEWHDGFFRGLPDDAILQKAHVEKLTLVTYDKRTIIPLLKIWGESGIENGGIIFLDPFSVPSNKFGLIVRSLQQVYARHATENWQNRIIFLRRATELN